MTTALNTLQHATQVATQETNISELIHYILQTMSQYKLFFVNELREQRLSGHY